MAGFAIRPNVAGYTSSGARNDHELTFAVDHLVGVRHYTGSVFKYCIARLCSDGDNKCVAIY